MLLNAVLASVADSMKIAEAPGASEVTPDIGTETLAELELSSMVQSVRFAVVPPRLVTSNQSLASVLLPLDHGATSEMTTWVDPLEAASIASTYSPSSRAPIA